MSDLPNHLVGAGDLENIIANLDDIDAFQRFEPVNVDRVAAAPVGSDFG